MYKNEAGKDSAIIKQIVECHDKGQPVLVGTISIEKSEYLSKLLKREGVPHNVLNAKQHEREAEIVAQAGKLGAVTIATNMAGRGTDIMLGGNAEYLARTDLKKAGYTDEVIAEATGYAETDERGGPRRARALRRAHGRAQEGHRRRGRAVKAAGGLFILGTERHESRRIDNQLRGRAGRQGDPGESRFYLAMTDDIMRLFGSERIMSMMDTLKIDEDTPLDQKMLTGAIEQAQKTVESRNFQTRKNVLEYDDVMNVQRNVIYAERKKVLDGEDLQPAIRKMIEEFVESTVADGFAQEHPADLRAVNEILAPFGRLFLAPGDIRLTEADLASLTADKLSEMVLERAFAFYEKKEAALGAAPNGAPLMREVERVVMLRVVDEYWMDHLDAMTELRRGIGLRGYGATKPIDAYKNEGFEMFEAMIRGIREETVRRLFIVRVTQASSPWSARASPGTRPPTSAASRRRNSPSVRSRSPAATTPAPAASSGPTACP